MITWHPIPSKVPVKGTEVILFKENCTGYPRIDFGTWQTDENPSYGHHAWVRKKTKLNLVLVEHNYDYWAHAKDFDFPKIEK